MNNKPTQTPAQFFSICFRSFLRHTLFVSILFTCLQPNKGILAQEGIQNEKINTIVSHPDPYLETPKTKEALAV